MLYNNGVERCRIDTLDHVTSNRMHASLIAEPPCFHAPSIAKQILENTWNVFLRLQWKGSIISRIARGAYPPDPPPPNRSVPAARTLIHLPLLATPLVPHPGLLKDQPVITERTFWPCIGPRVYTAKRGVSLEAFILENPLNGGTSCMQQTVWCHGGRLSHKRKNQAYTQVLGYFQAFVDYFKKKFSLRAEDSLTSGGVHSQVSSFIL